MATEIMGNKYLILVFNHPETRSPVIVGKGNSNIRIVNIAKGDKIEFDKKESVLTLPFAEKYHMLTQQVHAALKWAAEYRSTFAWDFVVKLEGDTLLDLDSLIKLNIDDNCDIFSTFSMTKPNAGAIDNGGFWIAGPRVVDTYIHSQLPTDYYNAETWPRLERLVSTPEARAAAIPEHKWFWQKVFNTVPFAKIDGQFFICGHFSGKQGGSREAVQLLAIKTLQGLLFIEEPTVEAQAAILKRKLIENRKNGGSNIRIVTSAFGQQENAYLKPMIASAKQFLLTDFEKHFVVYTDEPDFAKTVLQGLTNIVIVPCNEEHYVLVQENIHCKSNSWNTPSPDWLIVADNRLVFIKPVDVEVLPTMVDMGVSTPGIYRINDKGQFMNATVGQVPIPTFNSSQPKQLFGSNVMIPDGAKDKVAVNHFFTIIDINPMMPINEFLDTYAEMDKLDIQEFNNHPFMLWFINYFYSTRELFPKVLPPAYCMPIVKDNNDLTQVRIVRDGRIPPTESPKKHGEHLVEIGHKGESAARQIEKYVWFKRLLKKYPNAKIHAKDKFAWEIFDDEVYQYIALGPDAKVSIEVNSDNDPNVDGLMADIRFVGNVHAELEQEDIKPFLNNWELEGMLRLVGMFAKKEKCLIVWENAPDMTNAQLSKYSTVFIVTENGKSEMSIAENMVEVNLAELSGFEQLQFAKVMAKVKENVGEYGKTPMSRLVKKIAENA